MRRLHRWFGLRAISALLFLSLTVMGRGEVFAGGQRSFRDTPRPWGNRTVEPSQIERLRRVMMPLFQAANHRRPLSEIRVRIAEENRINAASAGGGEFYVTTGLLNKSTDDQLRGVLAHEIAHDDLGHPARAQMMGVGLNLGVVLLEKIFPGSSAITPLAGALFANNYSQPQEYEADRHAVEILRRAGYSKEIMVDALTWVMQNEGNSGGGFLSSHPATKDRIRALRQQA
jgi:predicted Zn-dependent protease